MRRHHRIIKTTAMAKIYIFIYISGRFGGDEGFIGAAG